MTTCPSIISNGWGQLRRIARRNSLEGPFGLGHEAQEQGKYDVWRTEVIFVHKHRQELPSEDFIYRALPKMRGLLYDLPDELIILCIESIIDHLTLCRVALTCKKLQILAEAVLYRDPTVRSSPRWRSLHQSILLKARRAEAIQKINAAFAWDGQAWSKQEKHEMLDVIARAKRLRTLLVESSAANHGHWSDDKAWPPLMDGFLDLFVTASHGLHKPSTGLILPSLRELTLHWNGVEDRYWTLGGRSSHILALPNLQDLTISCANVLDSVTDAIRNYPKIPLKSLTLIECNVSQLGFEKILARSKALQSLHLGENRYHLQHIVALDSAARHSIQSLCLRDVSRFIHALSQHEQTLRRFSYLPFEDSNPANPLLLMAKAASHTPTTGFSTFKALREIILEGECQQIQELLTTEALRPPNLETLQVIGQPCFIHANPMAIPAEFLSNIDLPIEELLTASPLLRFCQAIHLYPHFRELHISTCEPIHNSAGRRRKRALDLAVEQLTTRPIRFCVTTQLRWTRVFPPFLHDQSPTDRFPVFDTARGGWAEVVANMDDEDTRIFDAGI